jgi:hypothetical protein
MSRKAYRRAGAGAAPDSAIGTCPSCASPLRLSGSLVAFGYFAFVRHSSQNAPLAHRGFVLRDGLRKADGAWDEAALVDGLADTTFFKRRSRSRRIADTRRRTGHDPALFRLLDGSMSRMSMRRKAQGMRLP